MANAVPVVNVKLPNLNVPPKPRQPSRGARRRARRNAGRSQGLGNTSSDYYLNALLNPEESEGTKVPDAIGYPTGTFQMEAQGTLTTGGTSGDSVMITLYPVIGNGSINYPIVICNGTGANSLSSQVGINWPSRGSVDTSFKAFRPVSAMLEVSFIGNSSADAGRLCCGTCFTGDVSGLPTSWTSASNMAGMSTWPCKNGARVLWKPLDNSNFEFVASNALPNYPTCYVAITGLQPAVTTFMYRVVANYEAVPINDALSYIETGPSPINLKALERAFTWAQEATNNVAPLVGVVGQALQYGKAAYNTYQTIARSLPGAFLSKQNGLIANFYQTTKQLQELSVKDKMSEIESRGEEDESYRDDRRSSSSATQVYGNQGLNATTPGELTRTASSSSLGRSPRGRC